ncbi:MAG TPA: ATP-binding protein [Rudaea sp.]|jgi:two-component system sensor histidine kinase BaeS|nr:ATP-binding protein [Rudaea sp.]
MRLWQRLFLAFAVLSGAALIAFAVWQEHSFRRGFIGYLDEVTKQRLAPSMARLAAAYAQHGDWNFLRADPTQFVDLIEPIPHGFHGRGFDRPPPPPPDDERPPPEEGNGPPPGHPPRGPDLMSRLVLLDNSGAYVAGSTTVSNAAAELPVTLDGTTIGKLRLGTIPQIGSATDVAFAHAQTRSAALAGAAILIGALLFSFVLARWLLAPVRALASGTRALATGDFSQRIDSQRTDELGALSRDFNHLAVTLEQSREARRKWGADIAHELRTPLSILRGEIQAMQDGVRATTPQALDSLQTECARLGGLIEDLYHLSLADAGALDYRFEVLDLDEIVADAIDAHKDACAAKGLELTSDVQPHAIVDGDARRLSQLLDNLLTNSQRYTDAPGRIRVAITSDAKFARLIVDDTAPGVPPSALPQLFDRLFRVESSRSRAVGGAGLGLSIAKAIVEAHHGRVVAEASSLGGLRIVVELPRAT